jgi:hypothetical protein
MRRIGTVKRGYCGALSILGDAFGREFHGS